jgi:hypothetical protein
MTDMEIVKTQTDDGADPAVLFLEDTAKDVLQRLNPAAKQAEIDKKVAAMTATFMANYGTPPPKTMVDALTKDTEASLSQAVQADMDALKGTSKTLEAALAAEKTRAEELPTAIVDAELERKTALTFDQKHQVASVEQLKDLNLRQDLHGAGFPGVLQVYQQAVNSNDRSALRFLERQRVLGWPAVAREANTIEAEIALEKLVKQTRAARVPASLRAAHARASKVWTPVLDAAHRLLRDGALRAVK